MFILVFGVIISGFLGFKLSNKIIDVILRAISVKLLLIFIL